MADRVVGVMQPYIFPYIGYFQLLNAVDDFIFYDDVNFIKGGWINRNNILLNGEKKLISFPCAGASSFKKINEIDFDSQNKQYSKSVKSIEQAYKKAPFFNQVFPLVEEVMLSGDDNLARRTASSVKSVAAYLGLNKRFYFSSEAFAESSCMERTDRLIHIIQQLSGRKYINSIGGRELYKSEDFNKKGIELGFCQAVMEAYSQFNYEFVSGLSIIDVLMFCSKEEVEVMVSKRKEL